MRNNGQEYTLIQYAFIKKNKELLLFVLRNGGSFLEEFTNGLPIFHEIFYSQSNPCREILVLSEISELLTKEFNDLSTKIKQVELNVGTMKANLNAINGAIQMTDKLLLKVKEKKE